MGWLTGGLSAPLTEGRFVHDACLCGAYHEKRKGTHRSMLFQEANSYIYTEASLHWLLWDVFPEVRNNLLAKGPILKEAINSLSMQNGRRLTEPDSLNKKSSYASGWHYSGLQLFRPHSEGLDCMFSAFFPALMFYETMCLSVKCPSSMLLWHVVLTSITTLTVLCWNSL